MAGAARVVWLGALPNCQTAQTPALPHCASQIEEEVRKEQAGKEAAAEEVPEWELYKQQVNTGGGHRWAGECLFVWE